MSKYKSKRPSNLGGFIQIDKETLSEIDYLHKLTPEDRFWYERFLDNEYNARIHKDGKDIVTDREEQKAANRHKQRRLGDMRNQCFVLDDSNNNPVLLAKPDPNRDFHQGNLEAKRKLSPLLKKLFKVDQLSSAKWLSKRLKLPKKVVQSKPKKAKEIKLSNPNPSFQTLEDFILNGGVITKVEAPTNPFTQEIKIVKKDQP